MVAWIILVASPCSMENVSVTLVHPMKPQLNSSLANLWSRTTSSLHGAEANDIAHSCMTIR